MNRREPDPIFLLILVMVIAWFACSLNAATITVNPGDSVAAAVQAAQPGDTINCVKIGTQVPVCGDVVLAKPVTITGFLKSSPGRYAFHVKAHDVTFTELTLDGSLCEMRTRGFHPERLTITRCRFIGRAGVAGLTPNSGAVIFAGVGNREPDAAPVNCKITNNVFEKVECWAAIYLCGWQNVEIAFNEFYSRQDPANPKGEGRFIKLFGQGADLPTWPEGGNNTTLWPKGLHIHHNLFSGCRGMAIEKQDGDIDSRIEDNYYEKTVPWGQNWLDNRDNWAFSIVSARSIGEIVRRNYIDCRLPSGYPINSGCFRVACEGGGKDQQIVDNYIIGNGPNPSPEGSGNLSIPFNGSNGTGTISGNRIVNMPLPSAKGGTSPVISNNGPNVALTWDINRPKPSASVAPPPVIPSPLLVTASAGTDGSLSVLWQTTLAGPYAISAKTSNGSDAWKTIGTVTDKSTVLIDGHPGWEYDIRVEASGVSNTARIRVAGDPTSNAPINDLKFKPTGPPPIVVPPATQRIIIEGQNLKIIEQ